MRRCGSWLELEVTGHSDLDCSRAAGSFEGGCVGGGHAFGSSLSVRHAGSSDPDSLADSGTEFRFRWWVTE